MGLFASKPNILAFYNTLIVADNLNAYIQISENADTELQNKIITHKKQIIGNFFDRMKKDIRFTNLMVDSKEELPVFYKLDEYEFRFGIIKNQMKYIQAGTIQIEQNRLLTSFIFTFDVFNTKTKESKFEYPLKITTDGKFNRIFTQKQIWFTKINTLNSHLNESLKGDIMKYLSKKYEDNNEDLMFLINKLKDKQQKTLQTMVKAPMVQAKCQYKQYVLE